MLYKKKNRRAVAEKKDNIATILVYMNTLGFVRYRRSEMSAVQEEKMEQQPLFFFLLFSY